MGIVSADFGGRRLRRRVLRWVLLVVAVLVVFWMAPGLLNLYTEWLWFKHDVRFPGVFSTILLTRIGLGLVFGVAFLILLLGNVELARRLARRTLWYEEERALRQRMAEVMEYVVGRYLYLGLVILAILIAYSVGKAGAEKWNSYLLFRHGLPFGLSDPVFKRDLGFYIFRLPFWQFLWQSLYLVLIGVLALSAATHYFDKAIRVLRGVPAFASHVKVHLSILLGLILVVKAIGYRIEAYYLLYSARGAAFGASYTDVNAQLLAYNVLFVIALACAALALINIYFRGLWLPLAGIGFLAVASLLLNVIYPSLVQRFQVQPSEFGREEPYIRRTIEFTRRGFDLEKMENREMLRVELLSMDAIRHNIATIENVRLWDYRPLLETYRKQQELQPYYTFNQVGIDRYTINGLYRQVMLAARELNADGLPDKSWQNLHVFYTHGYGVVMSPVSDVIQSGLPNLVIKDIPPVSSAPEVQVTRPGIYYGQLTDDFVIVGTTLKENDYPLPATNKTAETRYSGKGGVPIGGGLSRLAATLRFSDINILISNVITPQSRILWGRNIAWRCAHIAPFLSYDHDPYMVVGTDGALYWIQDAYTLSDMYPYSEPYETDTGRFSYVRNSVKVVTSAYDGSVVYYVADPTDPIVRTYEGIFPALFRPMSEMPVGLLTHIRYPEAFFNTQSARLTVYHMTDPRAFYNRVEKWEIAQENPKSVGPSEGQEVMQAYYAIIHLPKKPQPEFLLMLPFTPQGKPNMVAWLAGLCDGDAYGRLLTYYFPKTQQVWGPIQIEASISQDTEISSDFTLWNQQGSAVIRGNLLVLPLDDSILYVEPIYLRAAQNAIPELKRVIVGRGDGRVVMRPTLSQALGDLLGGTPPGLVAEQPTWAEVAPAPKPAAAKPEAAPGPAPAAPGSQALADQADRELKEALDRQRKGDWAGYGESLKKLQKTLEEMTKKARP
jgi:uncharacterized membrane protein (UPF0182 family)